MRFIEKEKTPAEAKKTDLHRHLEGSVRRSELVVLAEKYGIPFWGSTLKAMLKVYPDRPRSVERFMNRLITRYLRLAVAKLSLQENDKTTHHTVIETFLSDLYEGQIATIQKLEDLQVLNFLFCPRNIASDGDLSTHNLEHMLEHNHLLPEEKAVYSQLLQKRQATQEIGFTSVDYIQSVGKIRSSLETKYGIQIFITAAFRRDYDAQFLQQHPEKLQHIILDLKRLFAQGCFDMVDICGEESKAYPLSNYANFIKIAQANHLPFTVHAGETHYRQRKVGYGNLAQALPNKDQLPPEYPFLMVAHALRLLDEIAEATEILARMQHIPQLRLTALLLNVTSNYEFGLISHHNGHPLLLKLLKIDRELSDQLLIVPSTDDPNVRFPEQAVDSLGEEYDVIDRIVQATIRKGAEPFTSVDDFMNELDRKINLILLRLRNAINVCRLLAIGEVELMNQRNLL